jgi:membrane-associated protease RseP (regulator of RpoE activity)
VLVLSIALLTALVVWLFNFAFSAITVMVARRVGIQVTEVCVGFGPSLWVWRHNGEVWRFKLLPIGSLTTFPGLGAGEELPPDSAPPPGSFWAASAICQSLVFAASPVFCLLVGVALLGIPVWCDRPQLAAQLAEQADQPPWLTHLESSSTWQGQLQLAAATIGKYVGRLVTFRSLDGWGGYVAFFITAGRVGGGSAQDWITLIGLAGLTIGCLSLLPIPPSSGYQLVHIVLAAGVGRRQLPQWITLPLVYVGLLLTVVLLARVLWLDAWWVLQSVRG